MCFVEVRVSAPRELGESNILGLGCISDIGLKKDIILHIGAIWNKIQEWVGFVYIGDYDIYIYIWLHICIGIN